MALRSYNSHAAQELQRIREGYDSLMSHYADGPYRYMGDAENEGQIDATRLSLREQFRKAWYAHFETMEAFEDVVLNIAPSVNHELDRQMKSEAEQAWFNRKLPVEDNAQKAGPCFSQKIRTDLNEYPDYAGWVRSMDNGTCNQVFSIVEKCADRVNVALLSTFDNCLPAHAQVIATEIAANDRGFLGSRYVETFIYRPREFNPQGAYPEFSKVAKPGYFNRKTSEPKTIPLVRVPEAVERAFAQNYEWLVPEHVQRRNEGLNAYRVFALQ